MQCANAAGVDFGLALGVSTTLGFENAKYIFENPKNILNLINI